MLTKGELTDCVFDCKNFAIHALLASCISQTGNRNNTIWFTQLTSIIRIANDLVVLQGEGDGETQWLHSQGFFKFQGLTGPSKKCKPICPKPGTS